MHAYRPLRSATRASEGERELRPLRRDVPRDANENTREIYEGMKRCSSVLLSPAQPTFSPFTQQKYLR